MSRTLAFAFLTTTALAGTAFAQAQLVPKDDTLKGANEEDVEGWNPYLSGTATLNLVSNSNVVGQVDGTSMLFGLGLLGGADYFKDKHALRSTLSISESFARTPVVDEFVKTNDVVQLEGLYNYFLTKKTGLFGRLNIQTSLFPATDVRGESTSWVEKNPAGALPLATNAFRQRLARSFAPFTLNESVGVFYDPKSSEKLTLTFRLGAGGRQTFASSVLLIDDDKATPEVELLRLSDVYQLGLEGFGGAAGKLRDGRLTYRAGVSVLIPFVNNDDADRAALDLTRVGLEASASFNVFEWMSLVYTLSVTRDPQLFPAGNELTQVQNNLLLTLKYTFAEKAKKKKEPTAAEKELADAKLRAEQAEAARAAAEERVRTLEGDVQACAQRCPPATVPPTAAPEPAAEPTP